MGRKELRKSGEKCCGNFQSEKSPKKSFFRPSHTWSSVNPSALKPFRWKRARIKATESCILVFHQKTRWASCCKNYALTACIFFFNVTARSKLHDARYSCFYVAPSLHVDAGRCKNLWRVKAIWKKIILTLLDKYL